MYWSVNDDEVIIKEVTAPRTSSASPRATASAIKQELLSDVSVDGASTRPVGPLPPDTSTSILCKFDIIYKKVIIHQLILKKIYKKKLNRKQCKNNYIMRFMGKIFWCMAL